MSNEQILEGNKVILKFMGCTILPDGSIHASIQYKDDMYKFPDGTTGRSSLNQLKYHSSWDWSIKVFKKFMDLTKEKYYQITKHGNSDSWSEQRDIWEGNFLSAVSVDSPKDGFDVLVLAIKWYNENKTN